jgi:hypothetical protein
MVMIVSHAREDDGSGYRDGDAEYERDDERAIVPSFSDKLDNPWLVFVRHCLPIRLHR